MVQRRDGVIGGGVSETICHVVGAERRRFRGDQCKGSRASGSNPSGAGEEVLLPDVVGVPDGRSYGLEEKMRIS